MQAKKGLTLFLLSPSSKHTWECYLFALETTTHIMSSLFWTHWTVGWEVGYFFGSCSFLLKLAYLVLHTWLFKMFYIQHGIKWCPWFLGFCPFPTHLHGYFCNLLLFPNRYFPPSELREGKKKKNVKFGLTWSLLQWRDLQILGLQVPPWKGTPV